MQFRSVEFSFSKTVLQSIQQVIPRKVRVQYNTIQYIFYCQLPMGAFQRQILIVQVIKKTKKYSRIVNKQLLRNYLHIEFMTSQIDYQ